MHAVQRWTIDSIPDVRGRERVCFLAHTHTLALSLLRLARRLADIEGGGEEEGRERV
jgi:hypothetical protein